VIRQIKDTTDQCDICLPNFGFLLFLLVGLLALRWYIPALVDILPCVSPTGSAADPAVYLWLHASFPTKLGFLPFLLYPVFIFTQKNA
jgi:hypothetical protein